MKIINIALVTLMAALTAACEKNHEVKAHQVSYLCDDNIPIQVKYLAPESAEVDFAGTRYELATVTSASGVKYSDGSPPSGEGETVTWWTRGGIGLLAVKGSLMANNCKQIAE